MLKQYKMFFDTTIVSIKGTKIPIKYLLMQFLFETNNHAVKKITQGPYGA